MDPTTFAFITAILVNLVDMMGIQFTLPVTVPFGRYMGADLDTIAAFAMARGLMCIVSNLWMPWLSDRKGRKVVILMSLLGSSVAYLTQGLASKLPESDIAVHMLGKALAGFFAGTMPVIRAYVAELSMPDVKLLKVRMTILIISAQGAGIALAPIAGALATFGLDLPFYVCAGTGLCGAAWAIAFFREVKELHAASGSANATPATDATTSEQSGPLAAKGRPWCDLTVLLMSLSYAFIFIVVSGMIFLIPVMLEDPSFGLQGQTDEETEGNIAKAYGLMTIPQGGCQVIVALTLFVPVSTKLGELVTCSVFGSIAALNYVLIGLLPHRLWHLAIHQTVTGCCLGFIVPIMGPIVSKYASSAYPLQLAETQGITILGMNLALAFGQTIFAFVLGRANMETAWTVCGSACVAFVLCSALAIARVDRYILSKAKLSHALSNDQKKMQLATGGEQDTQAFIDAKCDQLRRVLEEKREHLWNGPVQFLITNGIENIVPEFHAWDDATRGTEYLKDVRIALGAFPAEFADFTARFPEMRAERSDSRDGFQGVASVQLGASV